MKEDSDMTVAAEVAFVLIGSLLAGAAVFVALAIMSEVSMIVAGLLAFGISAILALAICSNATARKVIATLLQALAFWS